MTTEIELSSEQAAAERVITDWIRDGLEAGPAGSVRGREMSLGGYAGTGKTTLLSRLATVDLAAGVLTPTGKAAAVLRSKGIPADTIHSAIYTCIGEERRDNGQLQPIFEDKIPKIKPGDFIAVDEASMVNAKLAEDIRSHGFNILWVGDHGQLEPVGEDPGIMADPDCVLETIHRQAVESRIIRFAHSVRVGSSPEAWKGDGPDVCIKSKCRPEGVVGFVMEKGYRQIIVGYNRTRHDINHAFRKALGLTDPITEGEKVICLRNNRHKQIFNGQIFTVEALAKSHIRNCVRATLWSEDDQRTVTVNVDVPTFGGMADESHEPDPDANIFDYGYAITCHKAQGSEWESVAVIDSPSRMWAIERWRYTAVTRASERVALFI